MWKYLNCLVRIFNYEDTVQHLPIMCKVLDSVPSTAEMWGGGYYSQRLSLMHIFNDQSWRYCLQF